MPLLLASSEFTKLPLVEGIQRLSAVSHWPSLSTHTPGDGRSRVKCLLETYESL